MRRATSTLPLILCLHSSGGSSAFVPIHADIPRRQGGAEHASRQSQSALSATDADAGGTRRAVDSRRSFLVTATAASAGTASLLLSNAQPAAATIMDAAQDEAKTFSPGTKLSTEEAKKRFGLARKDVQYLLDNYDQICEGGGDAVRRYLGTVGVASNMYGITKVVKDLRDEAEDLVEFTETANEFEAYLYQAEGAAYQSLFVEHSSAKGTPASFLATAKKDVQSMQRYMDDLAKQLNL